MCRAKLPVKLGNRAVESTSLLFLNMLDRNAQNPFLTGFYSSIDLSRQFFSCLIAVDSVALASTCTYLWLRIFTITVEKRLRFRHFSRILTICSSLASFMFSLRPPETKNPGQGGVERCRIHLQIPPRSGVDLVLLILHNRKYRPSSYGQDDLRYLFYGERFPTPPLGALKRASIILIGMLLV